MIGIGLVVSDSPITTMGDLTRCDGPGRRGGVCSYLCLMSPDPARGGAGAPRVNTFAVAVSVHPGNMKMTEKSCVPGTVGGGRTGLGSRSAPPDDEGGGGAKWSGRWDSNPRSRAPKARALPTTPLPGRDGTGRPTAVAPDDTSASVPAPLRASVSDAPRRPSRAGPHGRGARASRHVPADG